LVTTAFTDDQLKDIQGFGIAGFRKDHQEVMFVRFPSAAAGQKLIGWLQARSASAWEVGQFNQIFSEVAARTQRESLCATWIGTLISASGYAALGVSTSSLPAGEGANAFKAGMAARAEQIGDGDPKDQPSGWLPPFQAGVHCCIVIASDHTEELDETVTLVGNEVDASGCEVVFQESGETLPPPLTGHEHFGFKDGISQPAIDGYDPPPGSPPEPPVVPPGEFVLGFPNAHGTTITPAGALWTNGSFAVFRRLRQDVAAFRAQAQAGVQGSNPALSAQQTGAALVGRWPSGAPLELNPAADPGLSGSPNAFQFRSSDDDGHVCPHFAHIRKANPRDETTPDPAADNPAFHRMIRRGIPFGAPLADDATADDGQQRGLHFFCVVADLDQQFEFIQRQWLNSPNFPNGEVGPAPGPYVQKPQIPPDGPDPIVGEGTMGENCTLVQQPSGSHQFPVISQLVNVTAGEYFFVPSISALTAIGGGTSS
jgi:Dyp-type peroxidase family